MYEKFGQFIDGKWQKSEKNQTYEVINPATEEIIGKASKAGRSDVEKALKSAEKGLKVWRNTAPWQRSYIIRKIADKIREKQNVLAKWLTLEVGKPLAEGVGEAGGAADIFEWNAEETKRIYGQTVESRFENTRVHVYYQPVGVVAALVPWNFPITLLGTKLGPALIAGNTVVVKPAGTTPLTTLRIAQLFMEAGLPAGVLNVVTGPGSTVGQELLENPIVRRIAFTGASDTGKKVMEAAAPEFKRITLELGGSDPMIVMPDANLKAAVQGCRIGRFWNAGQACLAVKRLILHEDIYDEFLEIIKLKQTSNEIKNKLEQLLALDNNIKINVALAKSSPIGVDTKEDFLALKKIMEYKN